MVYRSLASDCRHEVLYTRARRVRAVVAAEPIDECLAVLHRLHCVLAVIAARAKSRRRERIAGVAKTSGSLVRGVVLPISVLGGVLCRRVTALSMGIASACSSTIPLGVGSISTCDRAIPLSVRDIATCLNIISLCKATLSNGRV